MNFFKKKYQNYSDEQLIPCICKGDERAFNELYKRYGQKLQGYFFKMLGQNEERANDFTQELFLKVIQKIDSFDTSRKFSTWLYTIAANMCKNEYRRISRAPVMKLINEEDINSILTQIPEQIDQQLFETELAKCVQELSPIHRQCFLLRYQEELSIKEISLILDCPTGTVKSRIYYCLKILASQLQLFNPNFQRPKTEHHAKKI